MLAESDPSPAKRTLCIHRVLLSESPEAGFTEDMSTRLRLNSIGQDAADNIPAGNPEVRYLEESRMFVVQIFKSTEIFSQ